MTEINGPLFIHSETGTEGGYWAIQDENFITPAAEKSPHKHCKRCSRWWQDAESGTPEPPANFTYWTPRWDEKHPTKPNTTILRGGYQSSDEPQEDGLAGLAGSFDEEWILRSNANSLVCYNEGHDWDWAETHDQWSYEGLHTIENGDHIIVFDKDDPTVEIFSGEVKLVQQYDQYAENARHAGGLIIHSYADDDFIDHDTWCSYFQSSYRGRITRA